LDYCDKRTTHSNTTWSNLNDKYILKSHSIYNEELDDYIFTEEMDKHNDKKAIEMRIEFLKERRKKRKEEEEQYLLSIKKVENLTQGL